MILSFALLLTAVVYLRGWLRIRSTRPGKFTVWRATSFIAGLMLLQLAVGPPMDELADRLLSVHMVEHLILMSGVPPLLLLGLPVVPLLRGFPVPIAKFAPLRRLGQWLVVPTVAWLAMNVTFLAWHIPAAYDFALENETVHVLEHVCFLFSSILFWWCVIRPWPATAQGGIGTVIYLLAADVVNTLISAFLAFCDRPVYSYYPASAHQDQVLGAVIMWVVGSIVFLVPAMVITLRLMSPKRLLVRG